MSKTILNLKNVKKTYPNGFQAIFNLNLSIDEGEFVVFVGPSGCGKTTTVRMIAGLERLSTGSIELKGRNITDLPARKRNVSMVFQNYALFPHLTVKENMAFTLKTKRFPRDVIEKKIKWVSEILNLKYVINRKPAQLSGGQRQRVALGRAMVAEPTLFLMDEPLSNLDAKLRGVMRTTIRKLHDQLNTTSIYVTHDQIEAMTMADKMVVMSNGFIQQVGKPEEVFINPANMFVANFIGNPSINLLKGTMKGKNIEIEINGEKEVFNIGTRKLLRKPKSNKVVLGIRPQHIKRLAKKSKTSFAYEVEFMEVLGAEVIVFCKGGFRYVSSVEEKPNVGDKINLEFAQSKVHLFDAETEISLTSEINESTMQSIKTFLESQSLIAKRTSIMEKAKNKKNNKTLYQKASQSIENIFWPKELLLNPKYAASKESIRELIESYKDAKRRNEKNEQSVINNKIKEETRQIKIISKKIKGDLPEIKRFKALSRRLEKLISAFEKLKNENAKALLIKSKEIMQESKSIKKDFELNLIYNMEEIKDFNNKAKNLIIKK